ncbi:hypothetical protein Tco_0870567, partial [Tanacetum coccineum]
FGKPKPTRMRLELADRHVKRLLNSIILGRPFLAAARAMIDVFNKKITLKLGQENKDAKNISYEHLYSASANEIYEKKPMLKDFPSHLEYAYLHNNGSFLIIMSSKLSENEKRLLLLALEKHKGAIAWKMSDIKRISPSFCTDVHKILMRLIYPISDSSWVSPIHVVPKKRGMTVVLNDNNELIPSCTATG